MISKVLYRDLLIESSNIAQNIDTIMVELYTIRKKYRGEKISKGDYDIEGKEQYTINMKQNF